MDGTAVSAATLMPGALAADKIVGAGDTCSGPDTTEGAGIGNKTDAVSGTTVANPEVPAAAATSARLGTGAGKSLTFCFV